MTEKTSHYSVCWIGNAGWLLRIGQLRVLIDPDLEHSPERKTLAGIPEDCLEKADAVLITHEHGDHLNSPTLERLVKLSDCCFVLPASCLYAASQVGIPEKRVLVAHHHKPIELFGADFVVTPIPALHGAPYGAVHKFYHQADCGYLIRTSGTTLFHPGDTVLLEEHFDLPEVDILMISPTEHNTNIQQSLILIDKLNPRYIFPQHRDTYYETDSNYYWTHAYDRELFEALDADRKGRYHILNQGEEFMIQ